MTEPTVNTIEQPGEFDVLLKLKPGQPYFTLVGGDPIAEAMTLVWAIRNRSLALHDDTLSEKDRERELRKSSQAEDIAWAMKDYRTGQKRPPVDTGPKTVHISNLPEETKARDAEQRTRADFARRCHNAIGELTDGIEELDPIDGLSASETSLLLEELRRIADVVSPKRPRIDQ